MPVYLCQPGASASEPWRHGIQVYAAPFSMDSSKTVEITAGEAVLGQGNPSRTEAARWSSNESLPSEHQTNVATANFNEPSAVVQSSNTNNNRTVRNFGNPIRRIRHAEIVLVDDVCVAYDRYWLRLRWPGKKGGFAGYIALGKVNDEASWLKNEAKEDSTEEQAANDGTPREDQRPLILSGEDERAVSDEMDTDDAARDDEPQDNASTLSAEPFESTSALRCLRTGLIFPSSVAMKLMAVYDDGLAPPVASAPLPSEPVFCRICREGLHDDADDEQPSPAMENDDENPSGRPSPSQNYMQEEEYEMEPVAAEPGTGPLSKGPLLPHPTFHPNQHAAENPMLAPCECSGSMAFVHYLCVEQWRCRSRHPEARQGLQCETCFKPYALPPPSARPANVMQMDNEDWLEAMPPHVMAALRQPHFWWQVGAAVVRRRWLRPVAPVLMSPVVALYCRARRLLKKKGVARRRWACSLCRRRARWKCVRCLRSYYCSRQCQNVSWHIVHKHVCYKPSRWAWSVVLYGLATLFLFPGILRDPLMYDLGLGFVPVSFYIMAILGGSVATTLKKGAGIDLRGRTFEVLVLFLTSWLVFVCWGLVSAFFGDPSSCHGVMGSISVTRDDNSFKLLNILRSFLLKPATSWFLMWDQLADNSGAWLRRGLCMDQAEGCFEHLHKANSDFFFEENGGGRCASDMTMVSWLYGSAAIAAAGNHFWKRRERQRRAARRPGRGEPHPHQD